jgi:hypothetical protein
MLFDFGHPKFSRAAEEIQFESFATRVSCSDALFNYHAERSTVLAEQQVLFEFGGPKFHNAAQDIQLESFTPMVRYEHFLSK